MEADLDETIQTATKILLQQDKCHSQLLFKLSHQETQMSILQQQLEIERRTKPKTDQYVLCDELIKEKSELISENVLLHEKLKELNKSNNLGTSKMSDITRRSTQILSMDIDPGCSDIRHVGHRDNRLDLVHPFKMDTKSLKDNQQLISHIISKWESACIVENIYDGIIQVQETLFDFVYRYVELCTEWHPESKETYLSFLKRAESAKSRFSSNVTLKRNQHRSLKKQLRDQNNNSNVSVRGQLEQEESQIIKNEVLRINYQKLESDINNLKNQLELRQQTIDNLNYQLNEREQQLHSIKLEYRIADLKSEVTNMSHITNQQDTQLVQTLKQELQKLEKNNSEKVDYIAMVRQMEANFIQETREILAASEDHLQRTLAEVQRSHRLELEVSQSGLHAALQEIARLRDDNSALQKSVLSRPTEPWKDSYLSLLRLFTEIRNTLHYAWTSLGGTKSPSIVEYNEDQLHDTSIIAHNLRSVLGDYLKLVSSSFEKWCSDRYRLQESNKMLKTITNLTKKELFIIKSQTQSLISELQKYVFITVKNLQDVYQIQFENLNKEKKVIVEERDNVAKELLISKSANQQQQQVIEELRLQLRTTQENHNAALVAIQESNSKSIEDLRLQYSSLQSQLSLDTSSKLDIEHQSLNESLQLSRLENDMLKKDILIRTQESEQAAVRHNIKLQSLRKEIFELREELERVLLKLKESEDSNAELHQRCLDKEEEFHRLTDVSYQPSH